MIVLFGFRWFVHGGGARQRQYWHLMPLLKRVGKIWQIVWQGPRFGFVAETGGALLLSTPGVRFHAFLPCFLLFFFSVLIPVWFSSSYYFVRAAVIWSSSASTCSSCVIYILPRLRIPLAFICFTFFVVLIILGRHVVFAYPVRKHLIYLLWWIRVFFFFVCFCLWPHNLYLGWRFRTERV